MKSDKKLQKIADQSLNSLHDEEFLQALKKQCGCNVSKKRISKKLWGCIGSAALVLTAVICCVLLLPPIVKQEKQYMAENLKSIESSVEQLNSEMKHYQIQIEGTVTKYYDSFYEDTLFYSFSYENDSLDSLEIIIQTNTNYDYNFIHGIYDKSITLKDNNLIYHEEYTIDDGIYFYTSRGEIRTQHENLYIVYNGAGFDENSNFYNLLKEVIA